MTRKEFAFCNEDKDFVRARADNKCEFPAYECDRPATPIVHHLTGAYVARLDDKDPQSIRNCEQNALIQCELHAEFLDTQEREEVEKLIYEERTSRILQNTRGTRRSARQKEQQLRKRKRPTKQSKAGRASHGSFSNSRHHR